MPQKQDTSILGHWRIIRMDSWERDYVDAEVKAFLRFDQNQRGEFQFGYVSGSIDYRRVERDGRPAVEWSWEGEDEMESCSGRGWAILGSNNKLTGEIFIHDGDDSKFVTKRPTPSAKRGRP